MRKDKKQLIGDEIGDDQIKLFLDFEPVDATSPSLHKLIKAYRGLRIDDFERFLGFFKEAGLDLDGKDEHGQTFVDLIKDQRNAAAAGTATARTRTSCFTPRRRRQVESLQQWMELRWMELRRVVPWVRRT